MREKKQWLIVTFYTTSAAMAAEKACEQAGLPGRIIPVPREIDRKSTRLNSSHRG